MPALACLFRLCTTPTPARAHPPKCPSRFSLQTVAVIDTMKYDAFAEGLRKAGAKELQRIARSRGLRAARNRACDQTTGGCAMPVAASVGHRHRTPRIRVKIVGCVRRPGDYVLGGRATVWDAIHKADGFASNPYGPAGIVTIRSSRKSDGVYFSRRRFDVRKTDTRSVRLRDRDLIVVQYDVSGQQVGCSVRLPRRPVLRAAGAKE